MSKARRGSQGFVNYLVVFYTGDYQKADTRQAIRIQLFGTGGDSHEYIFGGGFKRGEVTKIGVKFQVIKLYTFVSSSRVKVIDLKVECLCSVA